MDAINVDNRIGQKYLFDCNQAVDRKTMKVIDIPQDSIITLTKIEEHKNYFYDATYYFTIEGYEGEFWSHSGWRMVQYNEQNIDILKQIRYHQNIVDEYKHLLQTLDGRIK